MFPIISALFSFSKTFIKYFFLSLFFSLKLYAQVSGGSANSKVFQLSRELQLNYQTNGFLDFEDDNPYLSGVGLPSNEVNGDIEVILEFYPVLTSTSNSLWEQWRDNVLSGGSGLPLASLILELDVSKIRNTLYGVKRSFPSATFYNGEKLLENKAKILNPFTDSEGNWEITIGGFHFNNGTSDELPDFDVEHVWGEYETQYTHGGMVMPSGRYWLLIDYEFLYPVLVRPQAPRINGIVVPVSTNATQGYSLYKSYNGDYTDNDSYTKGSIIINSSSKNSFPEFNYANQSGVVLNSDYKKYRLNGTIGGTFINDRGIIRSEIYPDYKNIIVQILNPDTGYEDESIYTLSPNSVGEWDLIIDNLNTVGKTYEISVYGYNSYDDKGESVEFSIKRDPAVQPYAVNFYPATLVEGEEYEQDLATNFERLFFPKQSTITFSGSGNPGDKIETRLFPASYETISTGNNKDFFPRPLANALYMPKYSMVSSSTIAPNGDWTVNFPYENISSGLYSVGNVPTGDFISEENTTTTGVITGFQVDQKSSGNLVASPEFSFNYSSKTSTTSIGPVEDNGPFVGFESNVRFGFRHSLGMYDVQPPQSVNSDLKSKWCPDGNCVNWNDAEGTQFRLFEQKAIELGLTLEWYDDDNNLVGTQLIQTTSTNTYLQPNFVSTNYVVYNDDRVAVQWQPYVEVNSWSLKYKDDISLPKDSNNNYYSKYRLYSNIQPTAFKEIQRGLDDPRLIYFLVTNSFDFDEDNPINIIKWDYNGIDGRAKPNSEINIYAVSDPSISLNTATINADDQGMFYFPFSNFTTDNTYLEKQQFIIKASDNSGYQTTSRVTLQLAYNLPETPTINFDNALSSSSANAVKTYERQLTGVLQGTPNSEYTIRATSSNSTDQQDGINYPLLTTDLNGSVSFKLGRNPYPGTNSGLDAFDYINDSSVKGFFLSNEYFIDVNGSSSEIIGKKPEFVQGSVVRENDVRVTIENPFRFSLEVLEHDNSNLSYSFPPSGGSMNNPSYEELFTTWPNGREVGPLVSEGPKLDLTNLSDQGSVVIKENYTEGRRKSSPIYTNKVGETHIISGTSQPGSTIDVKIIDQSDVSVVANINGEWNASIPISGSYTNGQHIYFRVKETFSSEKATELLSANNYVEIIQGLMVIDTEAPEIPVLNSSIQNYLSYPLVKGTAEQWSTVTIEIDGKTYTSFSDGNFAVQIDEDLAVGDYNATIYTTDRAGNKSAEDTFVLTIMNPPSNATNYVENSKSFKKIFLDVPIDLGNDSDSDYSKFEIELSNTIDGVVTKLFFTNNSINFTPIDDNIFVSFDGTTYEKLAYLLKINDTPVAYITGTVSLTLNDDSSKVLIQNGNSNNFNLVPVYDLNGSTITLADGIVAIDLRSQTSLGFSNGDLESLFNNLEFYSDKLYEFDPTLNFENIFYVNLVGLGSSVRQPYGIRINLENLDDIPDPLSVTAPSATDTHRQDRTSTATFDIAEFSDLDKTDQYTAELFKITLKGYNDFPISVNSSSVASSILASESNSADFLYTKTLDTPLLLGLNNQVSVETSIGTFNLTLNATPNDNQQFNEANFTADITPININVFDEDIYFQAFVRLKNVNTPDLDNDGVTDYVLYDWKYTVDGSTDIPVIAFDYQTIDEATLTDADFYNTENPSNTGVVLFDYALFDPVDLRKDFTTFQVKFSGYDPLLDEGFIIDGNIININNVFAEYTATYNNGAIVMNGKTDVYNTVQLLDTGNILAEKITNSNGDFILSSAFSPTTKNFYYKSKVLDSN